MHCRIAKGGEDLVKVACIFPLKQNKRKRDSINLYAKSILSNETSDVYRKRVQVQILPLTQREKTAVEE
jgi:hypothetical protein